MVGTLSPIDLKLRPIASFVYYGSSFKFPIDSRAMPLQKSSNLSNRHTFAAPVFNLLTF